MRKWIKGIPAKKLHEEFGMYKGNWMPQMDRYWESDDGLSVMSRQIRTAWGVVEHVTIQWMTGGLFSGDIPWAVKQEVKDELFGIRATAIEVFPAKKHLVDVCDVYHLWVLPKDFQLPFGIHPSRDPQGEPVDRGYDYNIVEAQAWVESPERAALMAAKDEATSPLEKLISGMIMEECCGDLQIT